MKVLASILFVGLSYFSAMGQFGVRAGLTNSHIDVSGEFYSEMGPELAAHYWLRLKNLRIEFYPEVFYGWYKHREFAFVGDFTHDWRELGVGVPTRIYPFDLKSDCDCPTFSKQNDLFKKGFFLFIDPRLRFSKSSNFAFRQEDWLGHPDIVDMWSIDFILGLGAGLDIGISDLVTISPNLQYRTTVIGVEESTKWNDYQLNFGITATFRPDY